jgi:hypothetical protein
VGSLNGLKVGVESKPGCRKKKQFIHVNNVAIKAGNGWDVVRTAVLGTPLSKNGKLVLLQRQH